MTRRAEYSLQPPKIRIYGAVAKLRRGDSYHAGDQWTLHFDEKGGKSREIPVRHDLEQMIFEYLDAAGLRSARKDTPLFRTAYRKTGRLTKNTMAPALDGLPRLGILPV